MTTEEKAKAYAEKELVHAISRPAHPLDYLAPYFDSKDIQQAYLAGATEALASQWKDPKVELPGENEEVLILANGLLRVATYDVQTGEYCVIVAPSWCAIHKPTEVTAWLPIPPLKGGDA